MTSDMGSGRVRHREDEPRENLTVMLVHDLRNLLFGISGNLHLVMRLSKNLSADAQDSIRDALDFAREMGEMLHCVADVAQWEAGDRPLRPADCDVSQLIDKALTSLAALVRAKRHTVVWSPAPAPIRCDSELIERVALNLLRNAVETAPSGGRIEIRIDRSTERLRVSVSDNGPGVPREFQTLIFEKFGRAPEGRKVNRRSSGLGLVFCKLAVEAHGGTVGVESPPPSPAGAGGASRADDTDQGSTFWFELPFGHDEAGIPLSDSSKPEKLEKLEEHR